MEGKENRCWLCGKEWSPYGFAAHLERHHIFGGANRKKSEKYGLVVLLCGYSCHRVGPEAAHNNANTMQRLHEYGQKKAMEENGWTTEDFIREFGKNYINTEAEP